MEDGRRIRQHLCSPAQTCPTTLWRAVAIFAARCAWLKCFPRWFRLARAKFIPKPEAGKVRGLRLESLITKLIEKCILHPFFPATHLTPHQEIVAPEHFADRAKVSAEMTAGLLAIIIDAGKQAKTPLYILIADAKEAYDLVWRDAMGQDGQQPSHPGGGKTSKGDV